MYMHIHVCLWVDLNYVIPGKLIDEEDSFSALILDPGSRILAHRSWIDEGSWIAWACLGPRPVKGCSVVDSVSGSQLFPQALALARNWGKAARGRGLGPSFSFAPNLAIVLHGLVVL